MAPTRHTLAALGAGAVLLVSACGANSAEPEASSTSGSAGASGTPSAPVVTPVVGSVMFAPTPFAGSDGDNHLVYEISLTNYMRTPVTVAGVEVLDATTDREPLLTLDDNGVRDRLKPTGAPSVPTVRAHPRGTPTCWRRDRTASSSST